MHSFQWIFEWDNNKNIINRKIHGFTFEHAEELWSDKNSKDLLLCYEQEERWMHIAKLDNKIWTAIFTLREEKIRLISVRRARIHEKKIYENR